MKASLQSGDGCDQPEALADGERLVPAKSTETCVTRGIWGQIQSLLWAGRSERKLKEERLRKLSRAVEQSPASVIMTDKRGIIDYVNPKFCEVTGYTPAEACGRNVCMLKSGQMPREVYRELWDTILAGNEWRGEFHNKRKSGEPYWELASISPIKDDLGQITHFVGVKEDITVRKRLEAEREGLIAELQGALAKVKTLSGLLPICAWCKRVRGDRGYWEEVESFVSTHSEAQFSRGICPTCTASHFPAHVKKLAAFQGDTRISS
jgi:PAS domain S-box-containing protein